MKTLLCFLALLSFAFVSAEETLYFESATEEETTRIVLYLSEGEVNGFQFTGEVKTFGGWGGFSGNVATADGTRPQDEDAAFALELDFPALLKQDTDGHGQMLDWGFSGDIGVREEFRGEYPGLPWVLVP